MNADLGLPPHVRACLFDVDGVLTRTVRIHAAAWKQMFDAFLHDRADGAPFEPFDAVRDYEEYVDGRQREDGVRAFLAARGIRLPEGRLDDPPERETVHGLATRKNDLVLATIAREGVAAYPGSVRYLHAVRDAGLRRAAVSASENCAAVLAAAGIADLFDARVDGLVAHHAGLRGKPAPDMFLAAAELVRVPPAEAAVFEDALVGVDAARAGGFALVVGVDRGAQADALRAHGADLVVPDLEELLRPARGAASGPRTRGRPS